MLCSILIDNSKGLLPLTDLLMNTANRLLPFWIKFIFFKFSESSSQWLSGRSWSVILLAYLMTLFILELKLHSILPYQAVMQIDTIHWITQLKKSYGFFVYINKTQFSQKQHYFIYLLKNSWAFGSQVSINRKRLPNCYSFC